MASGTFPGYYRVTEVLEPFSGLSDIPPHVLEIAADRGTRVHEYCELYARGLLFMDVDDDCKNYVESFKKWFDSSVEEVLSVEERFFCDDLKISGAIDMVGILKGDKTPTIIDFKTPVSKSKTWNLQLAAYRYLYNKNKSIEADRRIVLQLPKNGSDAKAHEFTEHEIELHIYLGILEGYRYFNG